MNGYNLDGSFLKNLVFIFKFKNLATLIFVFVTFSVNRFFMKNVLLWCLMGVCVNKKIVQIFVCLVIDIYDFFLHMAHEKQCKNSNSSHKVPTFWEWLIKWKMQHLHVYNHKCHTLNEWKH